MTDSRRKRQPTSPRASRPKKPSFEALLEDQLRDPDFRTAWEATAPKRRIVSSLLRLRAQANLTQKELAARADWSPAFVSRLESIPREGERLYMPDLATLESYAKACGFEFGLAFGRPKGRSVRVDVAATASFGDDKRFRRALAALTGSRVSLARGGEPRIEAWEAPEKAAAGRTRPR